MASRKKRPFDAQAFLESAGVGKRILTFAAGSVIFSQGDPCDSVMYVRTGTMRLSVLSHDGKEAIIAVLGPGDFLGEGALAGHPVRLETARATTPSVVHVIPKREMAALLRSEHAFSDRFITHMLARNTRLEADLVDQLFNSSESGWRARCCCWRATAREINHSACCRRSHRKPWPKWWGPRGRG